MINPYLTELRDKAAAECAAEFMKEKYSVWKNVANYDLSKFESYLYKAGFDKAHDTLMPILEEAKEALALALSFAPKGPVPQGLDPTFYHTLNYNEEVKLQERIDKAHKSLHNIEKVLK